MYRDDRSNTTFAVEQATKLVTEENVDFVIGGHTAHTVRVSAALETLNMTNIQCCTGPASVYARGLRYIWGVHVPSEVYSQFFLKKYALEGVKKIAIVFAHDAEFTSTTANAAFAYAQEFGMEVTYRANCE